MSDVRLLSSHIGEHEERRYLEIDGMGGSWITGRPLLDAGVWRRPNTAKTGFVQQAGREMDGEQQV